MLCGTQSGPACDAHLACANGTDAFGGDCYNTNTMACPFCQAMLVLAKVADIAVTALPAVDISPIR